MAELSLATHTELQRAATVTAPRSKMENIALGRIIKFGRLLFVFPLETRTTAGRFNLHYGIANRVRMVAFAVAIAAFVTSMDIDSSMGFATRVSTNSLSMRVTITAYAKFTTITAFIIRISVIRSCSVMARILNTIEKIRRRTALLPNTEPDFLNWRKQRQIKYIYGACVLQLIHVIQLFVTDWDINERGFKNTRLLPHVEWIYFTCSFVNRVLNYTAILTAGTAPLVMALILTSCNEILILRVEEIFSTTTASQKERLRVVIRHYTALRSCMEDLSQLTLVTLLPAVLLASSQCFIYTYCVIFEPGDHYRRTEFSRLLPMLALVLTAAFCGAFIDQQVYSIVKWFNMFGHVCLNPNLLFSLHAPKSVSVGSP